MIETRVRVRFMLAALAAACFLTISPLAAMAGGGPEDPQQPTPGKGTLVVEKVENGPAFGIEFKFAEVNDSDTYLLGGYAGYTFDNKLFVGGAGYWQLDDYWNNHYDYGYYDTYHYDGYGGCYDGCGDYYGYHGANGYGGVVVEWFPLRTSVVSLSARGLVGGGVASVGWNDYFYAQEPSPHHGTPYPPSTGYAGYYWYDQGYFVFEPQVNVGVRIVPGLSLTGGVGYRVIGWANGWEDQIGGLTASVAIRFGK